MCAFVFGRTPQQKPDSNRGFQELVGKINDEYDGKGFKSPPPTEEKEQQQQQQQEEEEEEKASEAKQSKPEDAAE